jgi:glutamine phosphoribosylpyrophosphate amidotransferase
VCEQFVASAEEPFRLDELWPFAERLERYGIAGFGWGVAWLDGAGRLHSHRDLGAFRDDPAREDLGRIETNAGLVHLRRPSKLSTVTEPDTQPFEDPAGRFAFGHNGDLRNHRPWRERYRAEGRIAGRADSEAGQRWLEDNWPPADLARPNGDLLATLHETFGGQANLALLTPDGVVRHYAGNTENPLFSFRLGPLRLVSTGIYSIDRSLFHLVAPGATNRHVVPAGFTAILASARPARV